MIFGYARVSTGGQSLEAQIAQLKAAGCEQIVKEKESGIKTDRPQLAKLMKTIGVGDIVIVTRLDRLARSVRDLLNILNAITDKKAGFKVLDQPALDTGSPYGQLLLNVLAAIGQFERELIIARTSEGRKRAKAQGVHMGRPPKLTQFQLDEARKRKATGEPYSVIAKAYQISRSTVCRL
jgi:DNA invertase Pin-like site-specific DNA recombinase